MIETRFIYRDLEIRKMISKRTKIRTKNEKFIDEK